MNKKIILISIAIFLFSGCSNLVSPSTNLNLNPMNEAGDAVITETLRELYLDEGHTYSAQTTINLSGGDTEYLKAITSENITHLTARKIVITSNLDIEFQTNLYEGGTSLTNGSLVKNFNKNRNFPNNNGTLLLFNSPNGVDLTDSLELPFNNHLHSDRDFSITSSDNIEYILASNKTYFLEIINDGNSNLEVDISWEWFEHTHLN